MLHGKYSRAEKSIAKQKREAKRLIRKRRRSRSSNVVSIIPVQITSLDNGFDEDNYIDRSMLAAHLIVYLSMMNDDLVRAIG